MLKWKTKYSFVRIVGRNSFLVSRNKNFSQKKDSRMNQPAALTVGDCASNKPTKVNVNTTRLPAPIVVLKHRFLLNQPGLGLSIAVIAFKNFGNEGN